MVFTAKSEIEVGEQMAEEETNGAIDEEPMGDAVAHPDDKSADGNGKASSDDKPSFVVPPNSLWVDLENGNLPLEVSERIIKRAKELEEKRKKKKRKEAEEALCKYPGLSFNPEIELRKWEIHEQKREQMMDRLEEDIEIFAEVTEELEHENLAKRTEIEDLMKYLALGSPNTETKEEEKEKSRSEVYDARNDLKWALEEQKKLEKELQREKDRWKGEVLEHQLTKRKNDRLVAECEKKKIIYTNPKPDEKLTKAENYIDEMRENRDSSGSVLPIPEFVPKSEKGRILEEREKMLLNELTTAQATLDKLRFDVGSQRDARDAEAIITWTKFEKLGLLVGDVEFYRPFYDEKFQRWVDERLWEQPTIDQVIHPGVRHAAQEISELWRENITWLLKKHAAEDKELFQDSMSRDLEKAAELGKTKGEEKPEVEKDLKDAKAEKAKLQQMNDMLKDFAKYLEDEAKKDENDMVPIVNDKDDQRKELIDKIQECDKIIMELRDEVPSAREEIEKYRSMLNDEDKRRGEKFRDFELDEDDIIRELAKKAVDEARPREPEGKKADEEKSKAEDESKVVDDKPKEANEIAAEMSIDIDGAASATATDPMDGDSIDIVEHVGRVSTKKKKRVELGAEASDELGAEASDELM